MASISNFFNRIGQALNGSDKPVESQKTVIQIAAIATAILLGGRIAFTKPLVTGVPLLTLTLSITSFAYYYPEKILDKIHQVMEYLKPSTN